MVNQIAFCFLLYDTVKHSNVWEKFFNQSDDNSWKVYSHIKQVNEKTQDWVKKGKIRTIKTEWCEDNIVWAWINLLKKALKDKDNKYFCILSGDCIPLQNYDETYDAIVSEKRSRFNIDENWEGTQETGLVYADQWCILNRKHAKLLVKLISTEKGKKFVTKMKKMKCADDVCYCSDELYPINWIIKNYGSQSSRSFKKEIQLVQTTYTFWTGESPHPEKFNAVKLKKFKKKICGSGSIFARKFNNKAARIIFDAC